jgi:small subunit ribosomal protein S20
MPLRTKVKSLVTKARAAMSSGKVEEAEENAKAAIVALDKAAQKGALHRANAARRKSRLMKQVSASKTKT